MPVRRTTWRAVRGSRDTLQLAEARCQRIADDPPREDYAFRTVSRPSVVRPAPQDDPFGLVPAASTARDLAASLGSAVTAFERRLGALIYERPDIAELRRQEAVEYGLRASSALRFLARAIPAIAFPPTYTLAGVRSAEAFSLETQAYLFRSGAHPSQLDRVLAVVERPGGTRQDLQLFHERAAALADFFEEWDGRPANGTAA